MSKNKHSQNKLWFRTKNYGWGWYPVTWEGWFVIIVFVLFITYRSIEVSKMFNADASFVFRYFFEVLLSLIPLLVICYLKGEKPQWRWGKKK